MKVLKKGILYTCQDPKELIEDGEGYKKYRSFALNKEIDKYIFDGFPNSSTGISFDTRKSLEEICMHFYMLGLERKLELDPYIHVPKAFISDRIYEKRNKLAFDYAGKNTGFIYNAYRRGYEDCFNEVSFNKKNR